ncbi:hypothetical protein AAMO2058_000700600 [Amorphochlora amoebiformis]
MSEAYPSSPHEEKDMILEAPETAKATPDHNKENILRKKGAEGVDKAEMNGIGAEHNGMGRETTRESNSDTESDEDGVEEIDSRAPPWGIFEPLTFKQLNEMYTKKNKRKRTIKSSRSSKSSKRFKELPQRTYPKAPTKISKVNNNESFRKWFAWATQVWNRQKVERDKRLGPRDLGYNDVTSKKWSKPTSTSRDLSKRGRPQRDTSAVVAPPSPVDDRTLPDFAAKILPKLTPGVADLPNSIILPVLNTWGFFRTFHHPLGMEKMFYGDNPLGIHDYTAMLSTTTEDLPAFNDVFSAVLQVCIENSGGMDMTRTLLSPEGKKVWIVVNPITWQYHLMNHLEDLEERRLEYLSEEAAEDGDKDGDDTKQQQLTARELEYYGIEREALRRAKAYKLPLNRKLRLLSLLVEQALAGSKKLHKHLDEGISVQRECNARHRKARNTSKPKYRREVISACVSIYGKLVDDIVQANEIKEKKGTSEKYHLSLSAKMEAELSSMEKKKEAERVKEIKDLQHKYPLRATTLTGKDRFLRRYYVFGSHHNNVADAIYVFDPAKGIWGMYDSEHQLQALIKFLNQRGIREDKLLKGIKKHTWKFNAKTTQVNSAMKAQRTPTGLQSPGTPRGGKTQKKMQFTPGRLKVDRGIKEEEKGLNVIKEENGEMDIEEPISKDTNMKTKAKSKAVKSEGVESSPEIKKRKKCKAEEDDEDSEIDIEDAESPYISKKLTRSKKREEISSTFEAPDINAPLETDEGEKKYALELLKGRNTLIASQLLFREDGRYLPCCYVCQEVLSQDEWHCPYTHKTFPKDKCDKGEFAILLEDAKQDFDQGQLPELNSVARRTKVIKALLMEVEAAILEESTLDKSKRDLRQTRSKWIEQVKHAMDLHELASALVQLSSNLKPDWIRNWFKTEIWQEKVLAAASETELAALLYAFDRAVLYNVPLKTAFEALVEKEAAKQTKSTNIEEFPAVTTNVYDPHAVSSIGTAQLKTDLKGVRVHRVSAVHQPLYLRKTHRLMSRNCERKRTKFGDKTPFVFAKMPVRETFKEEEMKDPEMEEEESEELASKMEAEK